jgi:hypothetical protein
VDWVHQLVSVIVGGLLVTGGSYLKRLWDKADRREDRLEERRRADYERTVDAYSAMLRAVIDYRALMTAMVRPRETLEAEAARHREVRALVSLVADPEIEAIFEDCLKLIGEAAEQPPDERSSDLAAADLAYKALVEQAKRDLEWRLREGSGDVLNAAKPRFLGPPLPLDPPESEM